MGVRMTAVRHIVDDDDLVPIAHGPGVREIQEHGLTEAPQVPREAPLLPRVTRTGAHPLDGQPRQFGAMQRGFRWGDQDQIRPDSGECLGHLGCEAFDSGDRPGEEAAVDDDGHSPSSHGVAAADRAPRILPA